MLRMLRHLRRGGKVAMLLDQNIKPEDGGTFVPFFGLPVPVSMAGAALALRLRCPITSGYLLPEDDGTYHAISGEGVAPEDLPAGHDEPAVGELTRRITGISETAVRNHPSLWLWSYKRWKHVPPDAPAERYPFYSKPYRESAARPAAPAPNDADPGDPDHV